MQNAALSGLVAVLAKGSRVTGLHTTCLYGHVSVARILLHRGADVSIATEEGWTALHIASSRGHVELVEFLLQNGSNPNDIISAMSGCNALHLAAMSGKTPTILLLLEHGMRINERTTGGDTALHLAASFGFYEAVEPLVAAGAAVNAQNNEGETPLHDACGNTSKSNVETVVALLRMGADRNIADQKGDTCITKLKKIGELSDEEKKEMLRILETFGTPDYVSIINNSTLNS